MRPTFPLQRTTQILHHLQKPSPRHPSPAMASVSASASAPAPWRSAFLSDIQAMPSPTFYLATLAQTQHEVSSSSTTTTPTMIPRVRTVIFRGMWASLPVNPKNTAALNPPAFTSDMPTLTTDSRMEKVPQLLDTETHSSNSASGSSSVAGPYEAVFWAEESQTQWRIRGHACIVGPDIEASAAAPVRAALQAGMRRTSNSPGSKEDSAEGGADKEWSWARELTAHFGNLSPLMRGSFRNPPPGRTNKPEPEPDSGLRLGQRVTDNEDDLARRNFRVVVLVPEAVDRVDLSDKERGRRWSYELRGDGSWAEEELWP